MATFQDLAQQNPNIRQQSDDWRQGRAGRGEREIDDFVGDDFKAAHPERYSV